MKVKEMIAALSKFNPESEIEFPVQTYTKAYPSLYAKSNDMTFTESPYGPDESKDVRIWLHLPEGFSISERKKK